LIQGAFLLLTNNYWLFDDQEFNWALEKSALPWTKTWDEPKYLPDFLMPVGEPKE
jgi:hypothetical protein